MLCVLPLLLSLHTDVAGLETPRWGITTRKNLENLPDASTENAGSKEGAVLPAREAKPGDGSMRPDARDGRPESAGQRVGGPEQPGKTEPSALIGPDSEKRHIKSASPHSDKKAADQKKAAPDDIPAKRSTRAVAWADAQQKEMCQTYLNGLRELFLKTRHYSIQGAPCKTNEYASEFLRMSENCRQDCPQGLLEQNGYSERIIRNITYLEKLGQDRCGDTDPSAESLP
jgi:hypothetical protein